MILGHLAAGDLGRRLRGPGLSIRTGPFVFRVRSDLPVVETSFALLYPQHIVVEESVFADAELRLDRPRGLRRWVKPQVQVRFEGHPLFEPLPLNQAYALLEWTMNWWITQHAHQYLLLHAAVVERHGLAVILPAPPGSGKSTLCAGLIQRGWRLLSDEMAMVLLSDGLLYGMARPVSLKNESIRVIRKFEPEAVLGSPAHDTAKGTVSHLRPTVDHVVRAAEPARARWVVFPRWVRDSDATLTPRPKADSMMELGRNAFNYALQGRSGFETLASLVSDCDCFDFSYSRLEDAAVVFDGLAARAS